MARIHATRSDEINRLDAEGLAFHQKVYEGYEEAIRLLQQNNNPTQLGDDFGGDEETIISQQFDRPVIIHRYPTALKAFYMQPEEARLPMVQGALVP